MFQGPQHVPALPHHSRTHGGKNYKQCFGVLKGKKSLRDTKNSMETALFGHFDNINQLKTLANGFKNSFSKQITNRLTFTKNICTI